MITQYFVLLFNTMVCHIGDIIDSSFINSMGLEAICITGILASIKHFFRAFYMYADYYFRLKGKRAKAVFYFTVVTSIVLSLIFYGFSYFVTLIYEIEPQYESHLIQCVRISAIIFTFEAVNEQMNSYMIYSGQGKLRSVINFVYYISMIVLDMIAVFVYHSIPLVIIFTGICLFICDIISYKLCGIGKEKYTKGDFRPIITDTFPFFFSACVSHLAMSLINIFATRLGTVDYAILVVCRKALEFAQNCIEPVQPLSVTKFRGMKLTYKEFVDKLVYVLIVSSMIFLLSGCIVAVVIKGELLISQIFIPCAVTFLTSLPTYMFFKLGHVKLMIDDHGSLMTSVAIIRLCIVLILCLLSCKFGIWLLLMYSTVVDLILGIYIYIRTTVIDRSISK